MPGRFNVHRFIGEVSHHGFVVLVLAVVAAGDGLPYRPQHRRQPLAGCSAEPAGLVEETRNAVTTHRGDEPLDEGGVDLAGLLEASIAQHGDDGVDTLDQGVEVRRVRDAFPGGSRGRDSRR